jgi:hypothetical protein
MEIPSDHSLMVDLSLKFLLVYLNQKKKKIFIITNINFISIFLA